MQILIYFLFLTSSIYSENFVSEAKSLSDDLKLSLIKNLTDKISIDGPVSAISYCNTNIKFISKNSAGDRINNFEFGRTSHKIRNESNIPNSFMESYLKEFQGKTQKENKDFIVHLLETKKKVYIEPLYIQPTCLVCHGENISSDVSQKIKEIYPNDKATGFKLGEFRGFIWIKEK